VRIKFFAAILILGSSVASCGDAKDWTLFVYPAGTGGFAFITPGFGREMCRFAGQEAVQSHLYAPGRRAMIEAGDSGTPTFECGRSCRIGDIKTVATCAETFDAND
jgi:hypothetical protein